MRIRAVTIARIVTKIMIPIVRMAGAATVGVNVEGTVREDGESMMIAVPTFVPRLPY
jgi:hypothetical protein